MRADEILERCQAQGIKVDIAGDKLRLSPPSQVLPDLLEEVKAHKSEIMAALRGETLPSPAEVADDLEACLRLGARLKAGTIPYLICGITGVRCTACGGVPCLGSKAP